MPSIPRTPATISQLDSKMHMVYEDLDGASTDAGSDCTSDAESLSSIGTCGDVPAPRLCQGTVLGSHYGPLGFKRPLRRKPRGYFGGTALDTIPATPVSTKQQAAIMGFGVMSQEQKRHQRMASGHEDEPGKHRCLHRGCITNLPTSSLDAGVTAPQDSPPSVLPVPVTTVAHGSFSTIPRRVSLKDVQVEVPRRVSLKDVQVEVPRRATLKDVQVEVATNHWRRPDLSAMTSAPNTGCMTPNSAADNGSMPSSSGRGELMAEARLIGMPLKVRVSKSLRAHAGPDMVFDSFEPVRKRTLFAGVIAVSEASPCNPAAHLPIKKAIPDSFFQQPASVLPLLATENIMPR